MKERERLASAKYRESRRGHQMLVKFAYSRAKQKGLLFDLPNDWKEDVNCCELTGIPFVKGSIMFGASIDRIDSSEGYIPSNCRLILRGVNMFKNTATDAEMYAVAAALCERKGL